MLSNNQKGTLLWTNSAVKGIYNCKTNWQVLDKLDSKGSQAIVLVWLSFPSVRGGDIRSHCSSLSWFVRAVFRAWSVNGAWLQLHVNRIETRTPISMPVMQNVTHHCGWPCIILLDHNDIRTKTQLNNDVFYICNAQKVPCSIILLANSCDYA